MLRPVEQLSSTPTPFDSLRRAADTDCSIIDKRERNFASKLRRRDIRALATGFVGKAPGLVLLKLYGLKEEEDYCQGYFSTVEYAVRTGVVYDSVRIASIDYEAGRQVLKQDENVPDTSLGAFGKQTIYIRRRYAEGSWIEYEKEIVDGLEKAYQSSANKDVDLPAFSLTLNDAMLNYPLIPFPLPGDRFYDLPTIFYGRETQEMRSGRFGPEIALLYALRSKPRK